uniref:Uncharacterized protein n=1 Tax=Arundo donax TaxID=35708 RepID=A0A0A8YK12_ARUDO
MSKMKGAARLKPLHVASGVFLNKGDTFRKTTSSS